MNEQSYLEKEKALEKRVTAQKIIVCVGVFYLLLGVGTFFYMFLHTQPDAQADIPVATVKEASVDQDAPAPVTETPAADTTISEATGTDEMQETTEIEISDTASDISESEVAPEALDENEELAENEEAPESIEATNSNETALSENAYYSFITHTPKDLLKVRIAPSENADSITRLYDGTSGYVIKYGADWCYIKTNKANVQGYVSTAYLILTEVEEADYPEEYKNFSIPE